MLGQLFNDASACSSEVRDSTYIRRCPETPTLVISAACHDAIISLRCGLTIVTGWRLVCSSALLIIPAQELLLGIDAFLHFAASLRQAAPVRNFVPDVSAIRAGSAFLHSAAAQNLARTAVVADGVRGNLACHSHPVHIAAAAAVD